MSASPGGSLPPGPNPAAPPRLARAVAAALAPFDRLLDRIYSSRFNPLQQSGNLVILFLLVSLVTGLYLFLFYRIGSPYESVVRIEREIFLGSWVRAVHRLSAELAMVAAIVHLLRKLAQGQTWGPRWLAWISGVFLLGLLLVCGWTGLVMVWDAQGFELAVQGARLLDLAPVFSLPVARTFDGETPVPSSFFFMNLFLHLALPLGLAALVWLHVSRLARPAWLPPREIRRWALAALAVAAIFVPAGLAAKADPLRLPGEIPLDALYSFWLPVARRLSPATQAALWAGVTALLLALPWLWRPAKARRAIRTSSVDPERCTGCETCYEDCPYEAIAMVPRRSGTLNDMPRGSSSRNGAPRTVGAARSDRVALVDPARCVGCGICAGSCAPMGVGPTGWTGREQLGALRDLVSSRSPSGELLVLGCRFGLASAPERLALPGVVVEATACSGSVHTSVIEGAIRGGFAGVLMLTCGPRACLFREGPKWLAARVHDGREAELLPRVDRRRVAIAGFSTSELAAARREIERFRNELGTLAPAPVEGAAEEPVCEPKVELEEVAGRGR